MRQSRAAVQVRAASGASDASARLVGQLWRKAERRDSGLHAASRPSALHVTLLCMLRRAPDAARGSLRLQAARKEGFLSEVQWSSQRAAG